jgi:exosortase
LLVLPGGVAPSDPVAVRQPGLDTARSLTAVGVLVAGFGWAYAPVLVKLWRDWSVDPNYSHGFVVAPLAVWFACGRRDALARLPVAPARALGLGLLATGLALLVAGARGSDLFLQRVSMLPVLAGVIALVWGQAQLRALWFPVAFVALMIPLPAVVFNQVTFPLQLVASRFGEAVLDAAGVPALREGNVIVLPYTTLEVVEACSGIRSLVSLLTVAIAFAYVQGMRPAVATLVVASTVPLAIVMNGLRVAGTGIAAHHWGAVAAEGFLHAFSGWLVFVLTCAALLGVARIAERWLPPR